MQDQKKMKKKAFIRNPKVKPKQTKTNQIKVKSKSNQSQMMILPCDVERIVRAFSKPLNVKVFQNSHNVSGLFDAIQIMKKPIIWNAQIENRSLNSATILMTFKTHEGDRRPYTIRVEKPIMKTENYETIQINFNEAEIAEFKKNTRMIGFYVMFLLKTFQENIQSLDS